MRPITAVWAGSTGRCLLWDLCKTDFPMRKSAIFSARTSSVFWRPTVRMSGDKRSDAGQMSFPCWQKRSPHSGSFLNISISAQAGERGTPSSVCVFLTAAAKGNRSMPERSRYCSDCSTARSRTNNDKSMVERCCMARLKGCKRRVQFSDRPETFVQQQKN